MENRFEIPCGSGVGKLHRLSSAKSMAGDVLISASGPSTVFDCLSLISLQSRYNGEKSMRLELLEVKLPSTLHSGDRLSLQNGMNGLARERGIEPG